MKTIEIIEHLEAQERSKTARELKPSSALKDSEKFDRDWNKQKEAERKARARKIQETHVIEELGMIQDKLIKGKFPKTALVINDAGDSVKLYWGNHFELKDGFFLQPETSTVSSGFLGLRHRLKEDLDCYSITVEAHGNESDDIELQIEHERIIPCTQNKIRKALAQAFVHPSHHSPVSASGIPSPPDGASVWGGG